MEKHLYQKIQILILNMDINTEKSNVELYNYAIEWKMIVCTRLIDQLLETQEGFSCNENSVLKPNNSMEFPLL